LLFFKEIFGIYNERESFEKQVTSLKDSKSLLFLKNIKNYVIELDFNRFQSDDAGKLSMDNQRITNG